MLRPTPPLLAGAFSRPAPQGDIHEPRGKRTPANKYFEHKRKRDCSKRTPSLTGWQTSVVQQAPLPERDVDDDLFDVVEDVLYVARVRGASNVAEQLFRHAVVLRHVFAAYKGHARRQVDAALLIS